MEEKFDVLDENGCFTGKIETRDFCHKNGLWHRAVYGFIFDEKGNVLLQKRSANKKLWPNLWDLTVGGHIMAGEFGEDAIIRETKEELGIEVSKEQVRYLVGSTSINVLNGVVNKHFNECYIITAKIDISKLELQKEEVSEVRWFSKQEIFERIDNNFEGLTDKVNAWNVLKKFYELSK